MSPQRERGVLVPERLQLRRVKGWRLPPNAVSVARPTKFGNPFRVGEARGELPPLTAAQAVTRYRRWLESRKSQPPHGVDRAVILASLHELRGRNLACWCPLNGEPCHADVLLELANAPGCRHCGGMLVRCDPSHDFPVCKGWKHAAWLSMGPVGPHYCEGRSVNPSAEPREEASPDGL